MKILIAADGSDYTKRMLAYLAAHDEWLGAKHEYTVIHGVLAVPHRAAAFVGANVVREFYESDAETVFRPIRAFFAQQRIEAKFVHTVGRAAESIARLAEEGKFDLVIMNRPAEIARTYVSPDCRPDAAGTVRRADDGDRRRL